MTAVCDDYYHLDLAWLRRRRMLEPGRKSVITWSSCGMRTGSIRIAAVEHAILLVYRTRDYGEEWQDAKQIVPFTSTATAFGGRRRWFACPDARRPDRVLYGSGPLPVPGASRYTHLPAVPCMVPLEGSRPAPEGSLHCATSSSNATPWVTNLAVLGTHHFQGIKQLFEGFHWSGAEVDRERDGAV